MQAPKIKTASKVDIDHCVSLIVLAFSSDPVVRWLFPEPHAYLKFFPSFVRVVTSPAFEHGSAHLIEGCATALWLPPQTEPDEDALAALIEDSIPESHRGNVMAFFEQMEEAHPKEPHWYLPLIGVDPVRQGGGFGAALLNHALALCDAQNMPAYLEATTPDNIRLYERHGFEVLGSIQAGVSPRVTPMLRPPR